MSSINLSVMEVILSAGGLGLVLYTNRLRKQQNKTQKAVLEIQKRQDEDRQREKHSAVLSAELGNVVFSRALLKISNTGKSEARNIRILIDGILLESIWKDNDSFADKKTLPPKQVGPGSSVKFYIDVEDNKRRVGSIFNRNTLDRFTLMITWDDNVQSDNVYSTDLIPVSTP